jgi:hypothetical protein
MNHRFLFWLFVGAALSAPVSAKMYKWVDEKGVTHYSDRQPPDQVNQGRQELNEQGVAVKQVERAKTKEEIALAAAKAKEAARIKAAADKLAAADKALLDSYSEEADIKRTFDARVELLQQQLESTKADIAVRERVLSDLLAQAARSEQSGKPVSAALKSSIDDSRKQIESQKNLLVSKSKDREAAKKDYETLLASYKAAQTRKNEREAAAAALIANPKQTN